MSKLRMFGRRKIYDVEEIDNAFKQFPRDKDLHKQEATVDRLEDF